MVEIPSYFRYYNKTFKLDADAEGNWIGYLLNIDTGEFELDNRPITEVLFATSTSEVAVLNEDDFIRRTEEERAGYLRGDGPIFALYDTIAGLFEQREREGRQSFHDEERALIRSIRKRTFKMWEEEFARRAAGEPPSFTVKHK
ncbi:hypothetical protein [Actinokineospora sp.]|uniref:hypothetical protein n=1 Tax=Actinokineospora sp. TaxID=1872133 RepID=UPI003D6C6C13